MKNLVVSSLIAATLATAPLALSTAPAQANHEFWHAFGAGVAGGIVGGVIANAIVEGQRHCHPGGCHSHAGARAYHGHDQYGRIIYARPVVREPVYEEPVEFYDEPAVVRPGRLPRAHYDWCYGRYRSYDAGSNTYQPLGGGRRVQCRSPYAG
jgi:hypothetical protein